MPRAEILLLAALLFTALLSLIFWPDPAGEVASTSIPLPSADHAGELNQTEAAPSPAPESIGGERMEAVDASVSAAGVVPTYLGDNGFLVTVVHQADQSPVADADVYLVSNDMSAIDLFTKFSGRDGTSRATPLRQYGVHYRTNEKGQVRLPRQGDYQYVFAELKQLYSVPQICRANKEELVFELIPNRRFKVKVVDTSGGAVPEIPIELLSGNSTGKTRYLLVQTNEDGEALLEGLNKHLEKVRNHGYLYVGFGFPMHLRKQNESTQIILTPERLAEGEVTLVQPGTCSMEVRVLEASGEPCTELGWISIKNQVPPQQYLETRSSKKTDQGKAHFPFIGLDTELTVTFDPGSSRNEDMVEVVSSSMAGDHMVVEIRRAPRTYIVGTIVNDDGSPLSEQRIRTREYLDSGHGQMSMGNRFTTDSVGRFRYELLNDPDMGNLVSRALELKTETKGQPPRQVRMDLPANPEPGIRDIGNVNLATLPLILSGTVLSQEGKAVAKSRVEISYAFDRGSNGLLWTYSEVSAAQTDQDGKFQIFGNAEQGLAYRASASGGPGTGLKATHISFHLGQEDLEIVLQKNAVLLGTVLIADDMQFGDLNCIQVSKGNASRYAALRASEEKGVGDLRISNDHYSPFSLQVQTEFGETILEIPNLALEEGKELSPPELQGIDVRGKAQWLDLSIQNTKGEPVSAVVGVTTPKGYMSFDRLPDGKLRTLIVNGLHKVEIDASGYVSQTLNDVSTSQVVTMKAAIPVTLQVDQQFLPGNDLELHIYQTPWPRLVAMSHVTETLIPPSGQYSTYVNELGNYQFDLRITHPLHGSEKLPIQTVTVESSDQHIQLKIDEDAYQQALDKMRDKIQGE